MGRTRAVAVGAFVLLALVLFGIGLFMIGDRRHLFEETFEVRARFSRLAGLQPGSKVRVSGMEAGEVESVTVPPSPGARFQVTMRVLSKLHPLVRVDSVATIQTDGIVGNKFVEIGVGSEEAERVEEGGFIESREPFEMADLMQEASEVVSTLGESVESVRGELEETLQGLQGTVEEASGTLEDVGTNLKAVSASARAVAKDVEVVVSRVEQGKGTLGKLVEDDALYDQVKGAVAGVEDVVEKASKVAANVETLSEEAKDAIESLKEGGPAPQILADLSETVASAREAMGDLAEDTESLKRNFFFRGMFEDRGYYDIDAITREQYLRGGLRDDHRSVRIWIPAEEIRDGSKDGSTLSPAGEARLDAAMRELLRYPEDSPLIVEGYGGDEPLEERFLAGRDLAFRVYRYVVQKYHRSPDSTGFLAMEPWSPEVLPLPDGASGSGVVLALYYDGDPPRAPRHRVLH